MSRERPNWGSVAVTAGITLLGMGFFRLGYVETDYAGYSTNGGELANESRLVDAGLGMERVELNETDVQRCRNSTFEGYRESRYRSFGATPLNPGQWLLYGGMAARSR